MYHDTNISSEEIIQQVKFSGQMANILGSIAIHKKITDAAKTKGIEVNDDELQQAADQLRRVNNLQKAEDTYAWLQQHLITPDDFEKMAYFAVLSDKLAEHLFAEQVEPYFAKNQLDYWQAILYEVVLDDQDMAQELYFAISEQEMSFFEVAKKYAQDTEIRRKCGYLGLLKKKDLRPEISASVFSVKPPQLLKPLLTADGAHLILVDEIIQPSLNLDFKKNIVLELFSSWCQT